VGAAESAPVIPPQRRGSTASSGLWQRRSKEHQIPVIAVEPGFTMTERTRIILPQNNVDISRTHPMEVPVRTVLHLCTCGNPMTYSGQVVIAADFVKEHRLL
jgi:hypothetical protein